MCGIIGIWAHEPVHQAIYDGLTMLQHRGQDSCGIATGEGNRLFLHKGNGLVRDVFHSPDIMLGLRGSMGIGHVRYPTDGGYGADEAQPFYVGSPYGITLGHNGQLVNSRALRDRLFHDGLRHLNTNSDSEVLLNVLAEELQRAGGLQLGVEQIYAAVGRLFERCRGGYAVTALVAGRGVLAFRDPHGIRPLVLGRRAASGRGPEYAFASESAAIDFLGFELLGDLAPGEVAFVSATGRLHRRVCARPAEASPHPCVFEYVYLARPDAIMDGISVYKARLRMGELLADRILADWPGHDIDVVIPVPDTSRTSALPLSHRLGVKYREGFVKNRYIPRTFIMPGQAVRRKSVRRKLNAIELEFRGKNVLLVDDSLVRGTTACEIVQMARAAGARKVYFASAAPPVRYPNHYGIDIPSAEELIAHDRTPAEVCARIGADRLYYQGLDDLLEAVRRGNPLLRDFDASCFDGRYLVPLADASLPQVAGRRGIALRNMR